jgi:hypothetical protein
LAAAFFGSGFLASGFFAAGFLISFLAGLVLPVFVAAGFFAAGFFEEDVVGFFGAGFLTEFFLLGLVAMNRGSVARPRASFPVFVGLGLLTGVISATR